MTSGPNVAQNLECARTLLERAARDGAQLAVLPENFALMGLDERDKLTVAEVPGVGPIQTWLSDTARELGLWIVAGTMPVRPTNAVADKVAAACWVMNAHGACVARYDKIHLFDVDIPGRDEGYRESATIAAGHVPVVVDAPIGRIGLSVCYDVRFPELYRRLTMQGAQVLSVPSAFTVPTGQAHWDVLLRARAIENLCFVLAPAQTGKHANGRETYGHSSIVDPWGAVLARVPDGPGVALATIDLTSQRDIRTRFPALTHLKLQS